MTWAKLVVNGLADFFNIRLPGHWRRTMLNENDYSSTLERCQPSGHAHKKITAS